MKLTPGMHFKRFTLSLNYCYFPGQLNFTDVVHIDGSIITDGLVDGVDVSFMCENVMTISTSQTISGNILIITTTTITIITII